MNLENLRIFNFVTHKDSCIDFSGSNSYYVYAENKDNKSMNANGSGKSLIIDAISWSLFGKTVRPGSPNDLVGVFGKYTSVESIWSFDDQYVKIIRYRKHSKYHNSVFVHISNDCKSWKDAYAKERTTDSDKYIQKLFRMDYDLFVAGVLVTKPKGELNFCESRDTRRKDVLTNLLALQWIDKALENSKDNRNIYRNKVSKYESEISFHESNKRNFIQKINEFKFNSRMFEKTKIKRINELKKSVSMPSVVNKKQIDELLLEKKNLKNQIKFVEEVEENMVKEKNNLYALDCKLENLQEDMDTELKSLIKLRKEKFDGTKRCLSCGSFYSLKNKKNLLLNKENDIQVIENSMKEMLKKKDIILLTIKKIQREIPISSVDLHKQDNEKYSQLMDLKSDRKIYLVHKKKKKDVEKIIEDIKSEKNSYDIHIKSYVESLREVNENILKNKYNLKIVNQKYKDAEYAMEAFGNSGIKNDIISSKIVWLEDRINYYLYQMTDGDIRVNLDNKVKHGQSERIGIIIQDSKKVKPLDYLQWSGGEKTRIRFATEFAINDLIETGLNLRIIDEGFEDVDVVGIKKILDIMRSETSKKMICISNRPDMKNIFKNSIKVTMKGGCSNVSQEKM